MGDDRRRGDDRLAGPGPAATEMTGGEAIVAGLLRHGVDTLFGIPGAQTYELFDALHRAGDTIRVICPRHEQATAYMAFGYAQSTGRPGVYSVVPGPGVLNASGGLCCAYGAGAPVLCLAGQVPSAFIGSGLGHLHELDDQLGTLRTLTKWAARIEAPAPAPRLVAEAFAQMATGRPRPVALEMPWDVMGARQPVAQAAPITSPPPPAPAPAAVERAAELLRGARHPMIMVGGGARDAGAAVRGLAERLQAPVVSFRGGRGIVSDEHPLGFTCAEGYARWSQTDVLLGIGSRLELTWSRWPGPPPGLRTITIDIDPTQGPRLGADVALTGDAGHCARALLDLLEGHAPADRTAELGAVKDRVRHEIRAVTPWIALLEAIRQALPRDGFFVEEICQAGFASYYGFEVYEPRTFVTCGYQGALGFGFPTALGVQAAHPDRAVVSITGDGGFQFALQELATAVQYGLGVVTVLFNNGAYGNVLRDQQRLYSGRVIASELRNPDFVTLAGSFGVRAERVTEPERLRAAVDGALARRAPALIEVPVPVQTPGLSPWRFLMPSGQNG